MTKDEVRTIALDILREALAYDEELVGSMTFAELKVEAVDFLDMKFRLAQKFGQCLSTPEIEKKVEACKGRPYDWINVDSYVDWVWERILTLRITRTAA